MTARDERPRCPWPGDDPAMRRYHDEEWGVPLHDDRGLFEFLTLEGAQAGLSWRTILNRRAGYRAAFVGWDIARIAAFDDADVERLLADTGIIRNRAKITATIGNARVALEAIAEHGTLDAYLWQFADGKPRATPLRSPSEIPAESDQSRAMSRALRTRGFRFVGPTILYAFMQATGFVNDHVVTCFRYEEL